jgi:2-polyprenyl-3-methyl-5-hydroxy-6-metoxy-1,4-benzoquinol methylase
MSKISPEFLDLELNFTKSLPENKNSAILDFGCGNGRVLKFLHSKGYTNLTGADIYTAGWNELSHLSANLIQISNSKEFLLSQKEKYDFIVVKDVIYYFNHDDVIEVTRLLKEALRPGGQLIIEIFNGSLFTGPYIKYKDVGIKLILTERSLKQIVEESGLTLLSLYGNHQKPNSFRGWIFYFLNKMWCVYVRLVYFFERGIDEQNPKILSRKIIAISKRVKEDGL